MNRFIALSDKERLILLQALRIATEDGSIDIFARPRQIERVRRKLQATEESYPSRWKREREEIQRTRIVELEQQLKQRAP